MDSRDDADGPSGTARIAASAVAVAAVGGALAVAVVRQPGGAPAEPLRLATVPAPHAHDAAGRTVLDALPQQLGEYHRAEIAAPAPDGAAAWAPGDGTAVVLRCRLE